MTASGRCVATLGCWLIGLLSVTLNAAAAPGDKDCTFWHAGELVAEGETVEIRAIARIDTPMPFNGFDPKRNPGGISFPQVARTSKSYIGTEAYIAYLDPPSSDLPRFLVRAGKAVRFQVQNYFNEIGPPGRYIYSGYLAPNLFSFLEALPEPLRCIRVAGSPHLMPTAGEGRSPAAADLEVKAPAIRPPPAPPAVAPAPIWAPLTGVGLTGIAEKVATAAQAPPPAPVSEPAPIALAPVAQSLSNLGSKYGAPGSTPVQEPAPRSPSDAVASAAPNANAPSAVAESKAAAPATPAIAHAVCDARMTPIELAYPLNDAPFTLAGIRTELDPVPAYWFDSAVGNATPQPYLIDLAASVGRLVQIESPHGKALPLLPKSEDKHGIVPVRLVGAGTLRSAPPVGVREYEMNVLVVADAPSLVIAGLSEMEQELNAKRSGYRWRVQWHPVAADGGIGVAESFSSFAALIEEARTRVGEPRALLSESTPFERFIQDLGKLMTESPQLIDFVIWIKEGYQLPTTAPLRMEELIKKVHERGNIPRAASGRPEQWLYVITGWMPGQSKAFLTEPMNAATPPPGDLAEEDRGIEPRRLLARVAPLAIALHNSGYRNSNPTEFVGIDTTDPTFALDAAETFSEIGILINANEARRLQASIDDLRTLLEQPSAERQRALALYTGPYNPAALLLMRSAADAVSSGIAFTDESRARLAALIGGDRPGTNSDRLQRYLDAASATLSTTVDAMGRSACALVFLTDQSLGLDWRPASEPTD